MLHSNCNSVTKRARNYSDIFLSRNSNYFKKKSHTLKIIKLRNTTGILFELRKHRATVSLNLINNIILNNQFISYIILVKK